MSVVAPEVRLLRLAARALRDGARIGPEVREALAVLLDSEAAVRGEMEPFTELLNAVIHHETGVESYIRFGRNDNGDIAMHADTLDAALALAAAVTTNGRVSAGALPAQTEDVP